MIVDVANLVPLVVAVFAIVGSVAFAVYVGRSRAEKSARTAILDELEARKMTNERLGRERDEAVAAVAVAESQVAVLEARTDLSALSEQIAVTTKGVLDHISAISAENNCRAEERRVTTEQRLTEQHREIIGLIGGMSALVGRSGEQTHGKERTE